MAGADQTNAIEVKFVDLPNVAETFADSIRAVHIDNVGLRIEFCVTRMDPVQPGQATSAHSYPVCRLVLPGPVVLDLIGKMKQVESALVERGAIKRT